MALIASLVLLSLAVLPLPASAWNIPGHMLSGVIAYQVLRQENPPTIEKVKAMLEKHPWSANQWQARLQDIPVADHGLVLFMQAARWPDDIRIQDKAQNRPRWHYINFPFKPEGQPNSVQIRDPEPVNILTAITENERLVKKENDPERQVIALAWLFHLVGDIHQPLHTAQLFTVDYPQGDRGGNEICVRVTQAGQPIDLHRFWDGVITSSSNVTGGVVGMFNNFYVGQSASVSPLAMAFLVGYSADVFFSFLQGLLETFTRRTDSQAQSVSKS